MGVGGEGGDFLNLIRASTEKPTINTTLNGEVLNASHIRSGTSKYKDVYFTHYSYSTEYWMSWPV